MQFRPDPAGPRTRHGVGPRLGRATCSGSRTRQRGYSLIAVNSDDDSDRQRDLLSLLRSQRVEGILLVMAAAPTPVNQIARMVEAGVRIVCLDRIPDRVPVDCVSVEDTETMLVQLLPTSSGPRSR